MLTDPGGEKKNRKDERDLSRCVYVGLVGVSLLTYAQVARASASRIASRPFTRGFHDDRTFDLTITHFVQFNA